MLDVIIMQAGFEILFSCIFCPFLKHIDVVSNKSMQGGFFVKKKKKKKKKGVYTGQLDSVQYDLTCRMLNGIALLTM